MDSELSRLCASVSTKCNRLRSFTEQIRSLAGQLGTPHDSEDLREKLHSRQHEALQIAAELVRCVNDLETRAQFADRSMKAQVDRVRETCIQSTTAFQAAQRDLVGRERESLAQARSKQRPLIDVGFGGHGDLGANSARPAAAMQQDLQLEAPVEELEERERAIEGIEQDIVRVNEMFRDFARLVHEQNDPIDSIAFNVETAHVDVASATQNMEKAVRHKRAVRKKKCICAIICLVLAGIVVLILIFAFGGSKKD